MLACRKRKGTISIYDYWVTTTFVTFHSSCRTNQCFRPLLTKSKRRFFWSTTQVLLRSFFNRKSLINKPYITDDVGFDYSCLPSKVNLKALTLSETVRLTMSYLPEKKGEEKKKKKNWSHNQPAFYSFVKRSCRRLFWSVFRHVCGVLLRTN